jgi:hypothetical protein
MGHSFHHGAIGESVIVDDRLLTVLIRGTYLLNDRPDITASVHDMEYSDVAALHAIDDDVGPSRNAPQSLAEIVASTAEVRIFRDLKKGFRDPIDDPVGNIELPLSTAT